MSLIGKSIGRYHVVEKLGEGGMGVVYRAQDSALGRSVAIKVLRAEGSRDPERVRRFSQEARAASALNHPNIVTVHDVGEYEGEPYLVMELVEGESLRARMERGAVPVRLVLDIGVQAATALARAHEAGITHRDLKPENILLRPDGYVKVLDFGLAKLKDPEPQDGGGATATAATRTSAGGVMGTAAYMSPEQAQGRDVDGRSDIFSLALVLLEFWGRNPFLRSTILDTLHAIVHDPLPAFQFPPGSVEWALARALEKALEKDPDDRYQTMKDLAIDLRRLRQESDSGKIPAVAPAAAPPSAPGPPAGPAGNPPGSPKTRRAALYGTLAIGCVVLAIIGGQVLFRRKAPPPPPPFESEYTQLTNFTGSVTHPALSPDGRMLAFIRSDSTFVGRGQVFIKLLPEGEPSQLTRDNMSKMDPVFSPDGSRIAYTALPGRWNWDTWVVPVLGGEPRQLLPNASGLTWIGSENGDRRLLFSEMRKGIHMAVVTATESRAQARDVYVPPTETGMAHRSYLSPDRRWVLVAEMDSTGWLPCRLVPFDGTNEGKPVGPAPAQCTSAAWSPDGKWMYFSANKGGSFHLWRQRFPDGAPEQVTFGATEEEGIAMAADGRSVISSVGTRQSAIWVNQGATERQASSEGYAYLPSFSSDGKVLYYLLRSGDSRHFVTGELWMAELDSGRRERLLPGFLMAHYDISSDGEKVLFAVNDASGRFVLWLASLDRRFSPRRLVAADSDRTYLAAGRLFFLVNEGKSKSLYRMNEDGSDRQKVIPESVIYLMSASPDGQWIAAWVPAWEKATNAVVAFSISGAPPVLICDGCAGGGGPARGHIPPVARWSPDGQFLYLAFVSSQGMGGPSKTVAIPLRPGQTFPKLPAGGIQSEEQAKALPGAVVIERGGAHAGPNPAIYAYSQLTTHRNLYRIPIKD